MSSTLHLIPILFICHLNAYLFITFHSLFYMYKSIDSFAFFSYHIKNRKLVDSHLKQEEHDYIRIHLIHLSQSAIIEHSIFTY
jgi:hypothetical protein